MSTITKTIGSAVGRDYPSVASWIAFVPANMSGNDYRGEVYNDSELTEATKLNFSGFSNGTITLTAATGQSWADQATPVTRYDTSKGACIKLAANFDNGSIIKTGVTISRLQIKAAAATILYGEISWTAGGGVVDNCIFENTGQANPLGAMACQNINAAIIKNCLILRSGGSNGIYDLRYQSGFTFVGNTFAKPSDVGSAGSDAAFHATTACYGGTFKDNAAFGFGAFFSGTFSSSTVSNCAADTTIAVGTSNQASLTYSSEVTATTAAALDLRPKAGNHLSGNGVTNANIAIDALGITRASPPTIGAIEYVVSGGGGPVLIRSFGFVMG